MNQDAGVYNAAEGSTWPDWTPIVIGKGPMTTVRTDAIALQSTSLRPGTVFLRSDGSIWKFDLHVDGDPSQGGTMFELKLVRA